MKIFKSLYVSCLSLSSIHTLMALELTYAEPEQPAFKVSGAFVATQDGQTGYLTLDAMLAHPDTKTIEEPYLNGDRLAKLTVLPFRSIWTELTRTADADSVIIHCKDGWMNYYTEEILEMFEPFVVLLIDGEPPRKWPIEEAMREHLSPFYISISPITHPEFYDKPQYGMMNPSAANHIVAVNFDTYFKPLFAGPYADIQPDASVYSGRKRFLNNCMACHKGPGEVGGMKSDRPLTVLKAHARYNADYFKSYVRNPRAINPASKMVPHPHFTENELNELIEFLKLGEL